MVTTVRGVSAGATAPASSGIIFMGVSGFVPVGAVEGPAQQASDKEENAFDDGENPASLEHSTGPVDRSTPVVSTRVGVITKLDSNGNAEVRAVGIRDTSVEIDSSDPCTHKANVDDCDEWARHATKSVELEQCTYRPRAGKNGNDEQCEESIWWRLVVIDIWVDKPTQHTNDGYGDDDFEDSNTGEEGG